MNTSAIFDTAMAGMQYAQAGMLVTSQNVSGSSVDGYVRRSPSVRITALSPSSVDLTGTSFAVEGFSRNYSALLQKQVLTQMGRTEYTQTLVQASAGLDAMLVDPSTSISSALGTFFNATGSLANEPGNPAYQQAVIGTAKQVATRITGFAEVIGTMRSDASQALADTLNEANNLARQLSEINGKIRGAAAPGLSYPSPDLLDERDRLATHLSRLVGGVSSINEDGSASHHINGLALVDREIANTFTNSTGQMPVRGDLSLQNLRLSVSAGAQGQQLLQLVRPETIISNYDPDTYTGPVNSFITEGKAGAYIELVANFVPSLERSVNLLAATLAHDVNTLTNSAGVPAIFGFASASGNPLSQPGSIATLIGVSSVDAGSFMTHLDNADPQKLRRDQINAKSFTVLASSATSQFTQFTGSVAASIENLRESFITPLTSITSRAATTMSGWNLDNKMNESLGKSLAEQKNAISGVNLDEEAANLVKYQQLYNASSKLIQTGQQMFNTLLSMLSGN